MKRMLCLVLAVVMCFGLMTVAASADGNGARMRTPNDMTDKTYTDGPADYFWGQSKIQRGWVKKVVFHSDVKDQPEHIFDFSEVWGGGVIGWYFPNELHIAANGKVILPKNSSWMFAYFTNVEAIQFNGAVDTSNVEDMTGMFFGCLKLKNVDVDCFNTSKVTSMRQMFCECKQLESVNVSGFDTSNVVDFAYMFMLNQALKTVDVSKFDTSKAYLMNSMFAYCDNLESVNVKGFKTANNMNFSYMFFSTPKLTPDVNGFDFSRANWYWNFLDDGELINGQIWQKTFIPWYN